MKAALTAERLREVLNYDPETGVFTWAKSRPHCRVGSVAGCLCKNIGYVKLRVDGHLWLAHRLAFLYMTGDWPSHEVDHINGARSDNRWANLRDVVSRVNKENMRSAYSNSQSGVIGVTWFRPAKLWRAAIQVDKKPHHLGYRKTAEEAAQLYLEAKRKLHEGCTI